MRSTHELFNDLRRRELDAELACPRHHRTKEKLVVEENDNRHGGDGRDDGVNASLFNGERQIGADARQLDGRVTDGDGLGRDDEEPSPGHRHHRVPEQSRNGKRNFERPKALPRRQPEASRNLIEVARHGAQRLIEREGHVPGLAREDREDRRALGAKRASGKRPGEDGDCEREKAQHGHRLQHVENGNEHHLRPAALGCERRIGEREEEREGERNEHAQDRAQRIVGQITVIERDGGGTGRRQRRDHAARSVRDHDKDGDDHRKGDDVPIVGGGPSGQRCETGPPDGHESTQLLSRGQLPDHASGRSKNRSAPLRRCKSPALCERLAA